jgi:hypothetical protein
MAAMYNPDELVTFDRIVLDRVKKGASINLGAYSSESLAVRKHDNIPGIKGKILDVTFDVLASKIVDDKYLVDFTWKVPRSWFQHLKQEIFPSYLLKKSPVKYDSHTEAKVITFTRMAEYPKANVKISKDSRVYMDVLGGLEVIRDTIGVEDV